MGQINAPVPNGLTTALYARRNSPWVIISSRPSKGFTQADNANTSAWSRTEIIAPFACNAVKNVYAGFHSPISGSGEYCLYNDVRLQSVFRKQGASINRGNTDPAYFAYYKGNSYGWLQGGQKLETDPVYMPVAAGERFFAETYEDNNVGAGPASLSLALASGGSLSSGTTYYVSACYIWANGGRSLPSTAASITPSGGNLAITVTAPAAAPGAVAYRLYIGSSATGITPGVPNFADIALGTNYTITVIPTTTDGSGIGNALMLFDIIRPSNSGIYYTGGVMGGTGAGAGNNGEFFLNGRNYNQAIESGFSAGANGIAPALTLGIPADGLYHPSAMAIGDSIGAGTGDSGYGLQQGGFFCRGLSNQTNLYYNVNALPSIGWGQLCMGGESEAQAANVNNFHKRWEMMGYATSVIDEYGYNDILGGLTGAAGWYANAQAVYNICSGMGLYYFRTTIIPHTATSDGYQTVANQSMPVSGNTVAQEGLRRQANNLMRSATGAVSVAAETPFRAQATATPSTNFYNGGDGTTVAFYPTYPFQTGTETVLNGGSACTYNASPTTQTQYKYLGAVTVNGATYADGIQFGAAPTNANTVTIAYTKLAGCAVGFGPYWGGYFDIASQIEVNGSGTPTVNGGWNVAGTAASVTSVLTSASNSTTFNDTGQTWTQDQYRGYSIYITSGTGAGQLGCIQWNTSTQIRIGGSGFSPTPDNTSHYIIFKSVNSGDQVHPSSWGHQLLAQAINVSQIK